MSKKYRHTYKVEIILDFDKDCSPSIKQWMEHPEVEFLTVEQEDVKELPSDADDKNSN